MTLMTQEVKDGYIRNKFLKPDVQAAPDNQARARKHSFRKFSTNHVQRNKTFLIFQLIAAFHREAIRKDS